MIWDVLPTEEVKYDVLKLLKEGLSREALGLEDGEEVPDDKKAIGWVTIPPHRGDKCLAFSWIGDNVMGLRWKPTCVLM